MMEFLRMFLYFLDEKDKKNFFWFVVLLIIGGFVSLLGVASVIPLISILFNSEKVSSLPLLGSLPYSFALMISVSSLIFIFWARAALGIFILKKQTSFLYGLTGKIRNRIMSGCLFAPYSYHLDKNSSFIISTISTDVEIVSSRVLNSVGTLLNELITSSIVFIALLFICPIFIVALMISVFCSSKIYISIFRENAKLHGKEKTKSYGHLTKCITQSLGCLKETKLYRKESVFLDSLKYFSEKIAKAGSFEATFTQGARYFLESVSVTTILVILCGYVLFGYKTQSIFVLLSVVGVSAIQLLPSINRITQALTGIQCAYSSFLRVYEQLKSTSFCDKGYSSVSDSQLCFSFKKLIELNSINFSYGEKEILKDFSIKIKKGQKVAFVGESGAGKTTIADIILGLLWPDSGFLSVDEVPLTKENIVNWQNIIGYIPQLIYIFDGDFRQNIAFGIPESEICDEQVNFCLKMASLVEVVSSLPDGIYSKVGENGAQLSGGQRQRIGIARALYRNPSLLIMDEATAALDNKTEVEVTKALTMAGKDRTIITIAHRISTIKHYDVIFYLKKGSIVDMGNYQQLIETNKDFLSFVSSSLEER